MRTLREQKAGSFFLVFLAVFAVLKFNQYLFFHFDTSPAVILMPVGIGLASVYLGGYRMWAPLACAWFLATLSSPSQPSMVFVLTASLAYPLQAVIGGYLLKRLNFLGTLERTRCALILMGMALVLPLVAPGIVTGAQLLFGTLSVTPWVSLSRAWAGGVLSIMVFTPLITTWYRHRTRKTHKELIESTSALLTLVLAVYLTFWTKLPQINTFLVLYALFAVLFWIGLRLHPRIVALALFITMALGMAGSIIAHPGVLPLNQQLLSNELFIILIAPIFYILASLVEERRVSEQDAQARAQELEVVNRRLSQEDRAKNDFLATLAHELRNPLAPVVSALELLKIKIRDLKRPDLAGLVEVADTHNNTLTRLLDDLLDISRISRNKFRLRKEHVELRPLIKRARRTVDALYKSRNHKFSVSIPEESLWIEADPLRFEQILINLLNNSAKYTKPGGRIELTIARDGGNGLRLAVKDNGIGIEPHMLEKIFESFVQSSEGSAGLGIGLSLTRRLVELHGGEIWAESEGLGKGSTFIVTLPVVQNVPLPSAPPARRSTNGFPLDNGEAKSARAYNILIVDDNKPAAVGLGQLLEHGGHTIALAYDGPSAIESMRNAKAEVVLLDIGLPDMDGYAVARTLREEHGYDNLLLLALTGFGQDEDKAKAHSAGFNYHLTKPVSIADVEAILAMGRPSRATVL